MAKIITLTIPKGMSGAIEEETSVLINQDNINSINYYLREDSPYQSIIKMVGDKDIMVKETPDQIKKIINS